MSPKNYEFKKTKKSDLTIRYNNPLRILREMT